MTCDVRPAQCTLLTTYSSHLPLALPKSMHPPDPPDPTFQPPAPGAPQTHAPTMHARISPGCTAPLAGRSQTRARGCDRWRWPSPAASSVIQSREAGRGEAVPREYVCAWSTPCLAVGGLAAQGGSCWPATRLHLRGRRLIKHRVVGQRGAEGDDVRRGDGGLQGCPGGGGGGEGEGERGRAQRSAHRVRWGRARGSVWCHSPVALQPCTHKVTHPSRPSSPA